MLFGAAEACAVEIGATEVGAAEVGAAEVGAVVSDDRSDGLRLVEL